MALLFQLYDLYQQKFPDHPGFNSLVLVPGSQPFLLALSQMVDCIEGKRTIPVTNDSIGLREEDRNVTLF